MKRAILILLVLPVLMLSQNYGEKIKLGHTFKTGSDSTLILVANDSTTATGDTVFSGLEYLGRIEGFYGFSIYSDSLTGGAARWKVMARFYYNANPTGKKWGVWNTIFNSIHGDSTYYKRYDSSTDSLSWYGNSGNGIQYGIIQTGAGKARHYPAHYIK